MTGHSKHLRLLLLACVGVGTAYVSAQWSRQLRGSPDDLVEVVAPTARGNAKAPTPAIDPAPAPGKDQILQEADRAQSIPNSSGDPISSLSWLPPPPPPPPPAPAPPPAAPVTPPVPFTYVGMLEQEASKPVAYLAKGDALIIVSIGDMLENNTYRVEAMNANEVVITYLPMNVRQTVNTSGGKK